MLETILSKLHDAEILHHAFNYITALLLFYSLLTLIGFIMPLHPFVQSFLKSFNRAPQDLSHLDIRRQRAYADDSVRQSFGAYSSLGPKLDDVRDWVIPGPYGDIPVRSYRNYATSPLPCHLNFHGGGWWMGNLDIADGICREIASEVECMVISVDYRLAPEHPFPIPVEECYFATRWSSEHAEELGIDDKRISVGGSSSGGNLAAAVCLMARDRNLPKIIFQLLDIPALDSRCDSESHHIYGTGYLLTREEIGHAWCRYVPCDSDRSSPYASPMLAENLSGLPSALILTAEYDPLRDEAEAYGKRLAEAGVSNEIRRFEGMIHGSMALTDALEGAKEAQRLMISALKSAYKASLSK